MYIQRMTTSISRISKIKKIILWSIIIGGIIALFIPTLVHGAPQPANVCDLGNSSNCLTGTDTLSGGTNGNSIAVAIIGFARILTFVAAAIAILIIVISGVRMIIANGNEAQYKDSLKAIQYAILGLVIAAVAYSIISIVSGFITTIDITQ
jgi:hypothetical protein